ncbi:glycosyltransferase [Clostridium sp. NSJ-145]|uniref:glycosyltransferase n=1 Tax=Clostridium sp. NSJ-145 TaxID=2897777 RepID=UPI001E54F96D|nr:glycosyltransferase [Clostridium sp. NSJ-145]MCD2502898.1 glycosyltransferase [Clostridium sp. NSJ-145]
MKKKLLFVIDSLHCAGAEKSLTTLLNLIDYSKYSVDLQLFGYGGEFEKLLPKQVNLLQPLEYTEFTSVPLKKAVLKSINIKNFKMLCSRVKYSREIRKGQYTHAEKARIFWQCTEGVFPIMEKEYDIAISYAQGIPTFYVADKINAKKKFAWVNVSYRLKPLDIEFQKQFYDKYNNINAVSETTRDILLEGFPEYKDKIVVIKDINDPKFINNTANIGESYKDNFKGLKILTIGRLAPQKGYHIALEACRLLKEKGVNFRWYVLGKGPLESEIKTIIDNYDIGENFKLLGVSSNPYPYIKDCDIYVQTSVLEGFGIAIAEARMLNKPVVTTRFDAVFTQMVDRKNGLVVDINGQAVCDGILEVINNEKLRLEIIEYLKNEKKGNVEELDKFYELIG